MHVDVVSDFNVEMLCRYLGADPEAPGLTGRAGPFGQLFQTLQVPGGESPAVIWAQPEAVSPAYRAMVEGHQADTPAILADVEQFAELIRRFASTRPFVFVAAFVASRSGRGLGLLDWTGAGHTAMRARMNLALADALSSQRGVHVLDATRWVESVGPSGRSTRHWFAMKSPFTEGVFKAAAQDIKAAVRAVSGLARKLVVVDLDDTLWGGIVGEVGPEGIQVGGHDPAGEAFAEFQTALKGLTLRGIQVGVVSKNDESVALQAIDHHPAMILRRSDLAGWRINWRDKAANIADLVSELNLGLASVVFIDDNPSERGRVREALPEVLVPEWPAEPALYADALRHLSCFDQAAITAEDRARTAMYAVERDRRNASASFQSLDDWLASLEIRVTVSPLDSSNLKRAAQLLNKTNQLNLRTRRLTEQELLAWSTGGAGRRRVLTFSVADRFGDLGLTGLLSLDPAGTSLEIADYLLSCRAMGRGVEAFMAFVAVEEARSLGLSTVSARAEPTERNRPCLEFWKLQSGFAECAPNHFIWDSARAYPKPKAIESNV